MFKIDHDDVTALGDKDLRSLVVQLCQAELRAHDLRISAITAGGHQDAPDGGVDVRVSLPPETGALDFIPRPSTGFQVKKPNMPRSEILKEMRPDGRPRPILTELAAEGGAYVIACSSGSLADSALKERHDAMREAVKDLPAPSALHLDFYDRDRLARWASEYPGVAAWVRAQLGKPLHGWQPFANWSAPDEPLEVAFIKDDECRLHDARVRDEALDIVEGIERMREVLARPAGVARLIGLSGMGKTRLVQALFDERIGACSLNPVLVVYTDTAHGPTPSPLDVINGFNATRQRAIVIVDNCLPDQHRTLAQACAAIGSTVSLLTVEYDVGDDAPEYTEVFRLAPASKDVVDALIKRRAPQVSQPERWRIAELSGGNARLALALARTVKGGESVSKLSDKDLFERLFYQGRDKDRELLRAAEICSLVYSFNCEPLEGEAAELPILTELAGMTVDALYGHVAPLLARELAQQRGRWRAVLPHALANHLAKQALDRLMPVRVSRLFLNQAPERLNKSFTRRLGYLHDNAAARKIAEEWLQADGLLGDINSHTHPEAEMFRNLAPVSLSATLAALERGICAEDHAWLRKKHPSLSHDSAGSILRSIAFEPDQFDRAAWLLAKLAVEKVSAAEACKHGVLCLCYCMYSGTLATQEQRLAIIERLLAGATDERNLGLLALGAMLETEGFAHAHVTSFGARTRHFGWHPGSREEVVDWFGTAIAFVLEQAECKSSLAEALYATLASKFQGLWARVKMHDELECAAAAISKWQFWADGWKAVRTTMYYHAEDMASEALARLEALEQTLRPKSLLEEARVHVFTEAWDSLKLTCLAAELEENEDTLVIEAEECATTLGEAIARDHDVLAQLLKELSSGRETGRRRGFGAGLAIGTTSLIAMWNTLVHGLGLVPEEERNDLVLLGFLARAAEFDPEAANVFLDDAIADPVLGPRFPRLQCIVGIDGRGVERLIVAIQGGLVPVGCFRDLTWGRSLGSAPFEQLVALVQTIAEFPQGKGVAIEVLHWKCYLTKDSGADLDPLLLECGRRLLLKYPYGDNETQRIGYDLEHLAALCLAGDDAVAFAKEVCDSITAAMSERYISTSKYRGLLRQLFKRHPHVALTAFINGEADTVARRLRWENLADDAQVLAVVPMETLLDWAQEEPQKRFPALAAIVPLFQDDSQALSPLAIAILEAAPDKEVILEAFNPKEQCGGSGRLSGSLERRARTLQALTRHSDERIAAWATKGEREVAAWAERERQWEVDHYGSFE